MRPWPGPRRRGEELKSQTVPCFTAALNRTVPPAEGSEFGLARKYLTVGWPRCSYPGTIGGNAEHIGKRSLPLTTPIRQHRQDSRTGTGHACPRRLRAYPSRSGRRPVYIGVMNGLSTRPPKSWAASEEIWSRIRRCSPSGSRRILIIDA